MLPNSFTGCVNAQLVYALLFILFSSVSLATDAPWVELKHSHKLTRKTSKFERIAALSTLGDFKKLLKPMLIERVSDSDGNMCVQGHIKDTMKELDWDIELDSFEEKTPYGIKSFRNIIATQNKAAKRQLVMACHFDSKLFETGKFIGATDSAVPCAMLLDLAKSLDFSLRHGQGRGGEDISLQLVFFDGEEAFKEWSDTDSIYGSRHLANLWEKADHHIDPDHNRLDGMDVMVLLDLIGTNDCTFRKWFQDTGNFFDRMAAIEKQLHAKKLLKSHPSQNMYFVPGYEGYNGIDDDHKPFLRRGVRILHLIPYPFPTVWHKLSDNGDSLSDDAMDNINKILRIFVVEYLDLKI